METPHIHPGYFSASFLLLLLESFQSHSISGKELLSLFLPSKSFFFPKGDIEPTCLPSADKDVDDDGDCIMRALLSRLALRVSMHRCCAEKIDMEIYRSLADGDGEQSSFGRD